MVSDMVAAGCIWFHNSIKSSSFLLSLSRSCCGKGDTEERVQSLLSVFKELRKKTMWGSAGYTK